jgi:hypothetical protein
MGTNRFKLLIMVLILSVTACTTASPSPTQTPLLSTEARTPTPSLTPAATMTPSPTSTLTPTKTSTPIMRLQERCVQISPESPPLLDGRVVFYSMKEGIPSYILDLKTGDQIILGSTIDETVSPDGSKVAYSDLDKDSIVISNSSGKKLKVIPDPDEILITTYWLDNQRLVLQKRRTDFGDLFLLPSLVILDPFTGEQQEWIQEEYPNQEKYPNIRTMPNEVKWFYDVRLFINPSLTRLVYAASEKDFPVILWDTISNREVTRIHFGSFWVAPWWSPDGSRFVVSAPISFAVEGTTYTNIDDGLPDLGGTDLFLVNQNGDIERLTYFSTMYWATTVFSAGWSKDGKQIAIMEKIETKEVALNDAIPQLMVVDIESGDVTNYCITGSSPIWSLDGKYILITQTDEKIQDHVILIDLQTSQAWEIAQDAFAQGWMVPEPK